MEEIWNSDDTRKKHVAEATVIDEMLGALNVEEYHDANPDPVLFMGADRAVMLYHDTPANKDLEAGEMLIITDTDGLASVAESATAPAKYGTVTITQDPDNSNNWNWVYTLNPQDPDARLLAAGTYSEAITITVTDGASPTANMTTHTIKVEITATGTSAHNHDILLIIKGFFSYKSSKAAKLWGFSPGIAANRERNDPFIISE